MGWPNRCNQGHKTTHLLLNDAKDFIAIISTNLITCPSAVAVWCFLLVDSFGQCSTLWYWLLYHCISAIYYNHTHSIRRLLGSHISFYMNQSRRKTAARRISSLVTCPVGITGNVLAWLQWELLDKQEMKFSVLKYIASRLNETDMGSFSYLL